MPDWMDEAKNLADDHSDDVDKGLDQATQDVDNKTGGKFDSEIQGAEQHAEGALDTDQQASKTRRVSRTSKAETGNPRTSTPAAGPANTWGAA